MAPLFWMEVLALLIVPQVNGGVLLIERANLVRRLVLLAQLVLQHA